MQFSHAVHVLATTLTQRQASIGWLALALAAALSLLPGCGSDPATPPGGSGDTVIGTDTMAGSDTTSSDSQQGSDTAVGSDTTGGDDWTWPEPLEPVTITPHESWKNTLTLPYDAFLRYEEGMAGGTWVKFAILNRDPTKVYFQNSWTYPLHQPFATAHLDPFVGLTPAQFDALTLHEAGQQAVLGALLITPKTGGTEYALQLVREDAYPKAQVAAIFALVAKALDTGGKTWTQLYFPTWHQQAAATADAAWLAQRGIEVSSPARWAKGTVCYAGGWTVGRLVQLPGSQLESAYASGTLLASDIVLTDQVPAEVPPVRGIVSSQPGTANSHVAVLAQNLGLPYVWLATPAEVAAVQALVGQDIVLRVVPPDNGWGQCQVRWWPASQLKPAVKTLLADLKAPQPLVIDPMQSAGAVVLPAADLTPTNLALVGGKAAHYGVLEAAIGSHVRPAKALTFDLWNHFLDQPLPAGAGPDTGKTLRAAIAAKLAPFGPQPNIAALDTALAAIRQLILVHGQFPPADVTGLQQGLASFGTTKPIRFRSSTNVEDTETFTGAGLYDSYSGCLGDDLDSDTTGPSACDANEDEERTVLRAIRKVYASFYNRNAVLERLRRSVKESDVGMAVLVHHSFPDDVELANGVATLRWPSPNDVSVLLVSQTGATSVTNPDTTQLPEVRQLSWSKWSGQWYANTQATSTLMPLGALVLGTEPVYSELAELLRQVGILWAAEVDPDGSFTLEFEWKQVVGEGLVIKQVRRLTTPTLQDHPPVLLGDSVTLCTFQGEYADVLANWRGKSKWQLTADSRVLDAAGLVLPLAVTSTVQLRTDAGVVTLGGPPTSWPGYAHTQTPSDSTPGAVVLGTALQTGAGSSQISWQLQAEIPAKLDAAQAPLLALSDLWWTLRLDHQTAVAALDWDGKVITRTQELVQLHACPDTSHLSGLPTRTNSNTTAGYTLQSKMFWPLEPTGIVAGYTAPLHAWDYLTVSGPLSASLHDWWALTYRPGHHNFAEDFVLEPALEPGLHAGAWTAAGVRALLWQAYETQPKLWRIGLDGSVTLLQ